MGKIGKYVLISSLVAAFVTFWSCSTSSKLKKIKAQKEEINVNLPEAKDFVPPEISNVPRKDTIKVVDLNGQELILMNTQVDENGEAVAHQVLDAAVVTARFRHLAERSGKIELAFRVTVPKYFQDRNWQLRYTPTMYIMSDTIRLERFDVTGASFDRRRQRGERKYDRYLNSIITDTLLFVRYPEMEIFLQRFSPNAYWVDSDTSHFKLGLYQDTISTDLAKTEERFMRHYMRLAKRRRNEKLIADKDDARRRFLPLDSFDPVRLDSVNVVGDSIVYDYVQSVTPRPKLRKIDVVMDGEIYQYRKKLYDIPSSKPLTFYVSSLSAFVDGTVRYVKKVIERRASASTKYNIDFKTGKWDVDPTVGNNGQSISQIKAQLRYLLGNETFNLDSVVVVASSSPDGTLPSNAMLSRRRSESISDYFNDFMKRQLDSLRAEEAGFSISVGDDMQTHMVETEFNRKPIQFKSRFVPENWEGLRFLMEQDTTMTLTEKDDFFSFYDIRDLDLRDRRMSGEKWYPHVKNDLYPKLRTVEFQFVLQRKGMKKDTIHTTVVDSVYMDGVQAIRDRDYDLALKLLAPYQDYNTAVAYCASDKNYSALQILDKCEKTAQVYYMLAIIHSRFGEDQEAVQCYTNACQMDPQFVNRGNLDPEISVLIKRYGLNKQPEDDFGF